MKKLLALLGVVLVAASFVAYYVFHEVVIVWVALALNLIKGLTFKAVLTWFLAQLYRWFLIEVPKKMASLMLVLGMPRRWRIGVKLFGRRLRHLIDHTRVWVIKHYTGLLGRNMATAIAVVVSTAIFLIGLVYFGAYVVWFAGSSALYEWLGWLWRPIRKIIQNILFKTAMFTQLFRLGRWVMSKLPEPLALTLRARWFGTKRSFVQRRRRLFGQRHKKDDQLPPADMVQGE